MTDSVSQHLYIPAAALVVAILGWIYTTLSSPLAKLPGPFWTNFSDLLIKVKALMGQGPQWVHGLHEQYGPIVRLSPSEVSVQDVSSVRQLYQVKAEYLKTDFYSKLAGGDMSVFSTQDVGFHRRQRRLLSADISEYGLTKHLPIVDSKVRLALQRMREESESRKVTDVFHWFLSMATDVIGELSFGKSFEMLETGEKSQYILDLQSIGRSGGIRVAFPFLSKLGRFINIPFIGESVENRRRTIEYAEESLRRHTRILDEQGDDAKPTLLSKLYERAGNDEFLTFTELRNNASSYIIAGSDTTANTLTYLIWMVCRHAGVKAKLLQELRTLPENFEYGDLKSLPYLNQVIEETLRLYPAAPSGLPRVVPPGGAQFAGHYVPAGYTVSASAWSVHRQPEVFPEPSKFDPSRWAEPTKAMKDSFVAFGGGSRVCLGLHLARMELRLATARFFAAFPNARVSELEGFKDEDMEPAMYFLLSPSKHKCLIEI